MNRSFDHVRIAIRRLLATPVFTGAAFLTLSLAVAAVATTFSVADSILLQPLPYPESSELVSVGYAVPGYGYDELPFSVGTFVHTRDTQRSFSDFAIYYDSDRLNLGMDDPERVPVAQITPGFFGVFSSPPVLGRPFVEDDGRVGADPVVIVSYGLWERRWGKDPKVVGRTVYVEGVDRRVVGIAPEGFHFPDRRTGLWIPFTIDPSNLMPMSFGYPGVARLAPGVPFALAEQDMRRITKQLPEVYPDRLTPRWVEGGGFDSHMVPLSETVGGDLSSEIWLVFGTAALLLLLAAANIANLFLVRAEERGRELAIREALGAGRASLLASPFTESLVVGCVSGMAGLGLAALFLHLIVRIAPPDLPRVEEIGLDAGTAVLGLVLALLAGVVFAALSMFAVKTGEPQVALRAGGIASRGTRGARRLQTLLVGNQAALAVALLVGAGLLMQTSRNLAAVDSGFSAEGVMTFEIGLPAEEYGPEDRPRVWEELVARIEAVESVEAVGAAEFIPLSTDFRQGPLHVEGEDLPEGESGPMVDIKRVTPGYFAALGIPILEGRGLEREDGPGGYPAVLANEALVNKYLGGGAALGRRVRITLRGEYSEIVGIVGDVRTNSFREEPSAFLYYPSGATTPTAPNVPAAMSFVVRTEGPPDQIIPSLGEAVGEIDPKLPLGSLRSLESLVQDHLAPQTLIAWVLFCMALVGLTLAAVGVYGVVAYTVVRRKKEVGVRLALGAPPSRVLNRLVSNAVSAVTGGALVGLGVAFLSGRFLEGVLFGVTPTDFLTYGLSFGLIVATALLASLSPAWRACRLDPSGALRED